LSTPIPLISKDKHGIRINTGNTVTLHFTGFVLKGRSGKILRRYKATGDITIACENHAEITYSCGIADFTLRLEKQDSRIY